ncbi:MAG: right-handed parallel beta-helix repeat-containing protein, partial [Tateyamaria sp.]
HTQSTNTRTWTIGTSDKLPFQSFCQFVDTVTLTGDLRNNANQRRYEAPVGRGRAGANDDEFTLEFSEDMRGSVRATVRMDKD